VQFAGFWRRFGAFLVDAIVVNVAMLVVGRVLPIYDDIDFGHRDFSVFFNFQYNTLGTPIVILAAWLYCALMESSARRATLGKMALKIEVTDLEGDRIGFGRASARFFAKFLSLFTALIGFFMAGFTKRKQALHDIIAKTLVISRR
jgi:uncharacterized RDD family membrane protein YckC